MVMPNHRKWISTLAIAVALIVVFYYSGVVNSKTSVGIAVSLLGGALLVSTFIIPPPEDN
jgi:hypothetical protein